jgi:hypothetical protein
VKADAELKPTTRHSTGTKAKTSDLSKSTPAGKP